jgi:hypothetical protein
MTATSTTQVVSFSPRALAGRRPFEIVFDHLNSQPLGIGIQAISVRPDILQSRVSTVVNHMLFSVTADVKTINVEPVVGETTHACVTQVLDEGLYVKLFNTFTGFIPNSLLDGVKQKQTNIIVGQFMQVQILNIDSPNVIVCSSL